VTEKGIALLALGAGLGGEDGSVLGAGSLGIEVDARGHAGLADHEIDAHPFLAGLSVGAVHVGGTVHALSQLLAAHLVVGLALLVRNAGQHLLAKVLGAPEAIRAVRVFHALHAHAGLLVADLVGAALFGRGTKLWRGAGVTCALVGARGTCADVDLVAAWGPPANGVAIRTSTSIRVLRRMPVPGRFSRSIGRDIGLLDGLSGRVNSRSAIAVGTTPGEKHDYARQQSENSGSHRGHLP